MAAAERLYLDHAATTPILPAAQAAMVHAMAHWANPSSPHADGRAARAALEDARRRIAAALGWNGHVIFTSGASEAIAIGLGRAKAGRIATSTVEHDAVLRVTPGAERIGVNHNGSVVSPLNLFERGNRHLVGAGAGGGDRIESSLGEDDEQAFGDGVQRSGGSDAALGDRRTEMPLLIAIQHVNNETGVIQPLDRIERNGAILFADCAQSAGKLPLPDADLIAISAHKFGGPPGIGALLVRDLALLDPSGGQEQGYRAGTENLPAIMGMAAALEPGFDWMATAAQLRARLDAGIEAAGGVIVAREGPRIATIASYRMPGLSARAQLIQFDLAGISVSAGSACSSGSLKTSHVLGAMGWDDAAAGEVVRVSFGPGTKEADIDRLIDAWRIMAGRVGR